MKHGYIADGPLKRHPPELDPEVLRTTATRCRPEAPLLDLAPAGLPSELSSVVGVIIRLDGHEVFAERFGKFSYVISAR